MVEHEKQPLFFSQKYLFVFLEEHHGWQCWQLFAEGTSVLDIEDMNNIRNLLAGSPDLFRISIFLSPFSVD